MGTVGLSVRWVGCVGGPQNGILVRLVLVVVVSSIYQYDVVSVCLNCQWYPRPTTYFPWARAQNDFLGFRYVPRSLLVARRHGTCMGQGHQTPVQRTTSMNKKLNTSHQQ